MNENTTRAAAIEQAARDLLDTIDLAGLAHVMRHRPNSPYFVDARTLDALRAALAMPQETQEEIIPTPEHWLEDKWDDMEKTESNRRLFLGK